MKKIAFLTGTRADFGKLKPLIAAIAAEEEFQYQICATGMHMLSRYGSTVHEIEKSGFSNLFSFFNQDGTMSSTMDSALASTVVSMGHYIREERPDMLVVHGDRIETLAGAIAGALNNVFVCHIEGGERSGTIDESIRHAVTKLSHLHLVANEEAATRLRAMGENAESIHIVGSPDIDVMMSPELPSIESVLAHYDIPFERYSILLYHPVTTESASTPRRVKALVDAVLASGQNYVVIQPNNDTGSEFIQEELRRLQGHARFRLVPSLRFESFLTLLRSAERIVGNSSAGIREAPVYGVETVNLGSRQFSRYTYLSIQDVDELSPTLAAVLSCEARRYPPSSYFGDGKSAQHFLNTLRAERTWAIPRQKYFVDGHHH